MALYMIKIRDLKDITVVYKRTLCGALTSKKNMENHYNLEAEIWKLVEVKKDD